MARLKVQTLGITSYRDGLTAQAEAVSALEAEAETSLTSIALVTEHLPCITLGRRGLAEVDVLWSSERLRESGFEIVQTERGGQATLHSPGQLVIYPITRVPHRGVRRFVEAVQNATQTALRTLGVDSQLGDEPGLYADGAKLVAFGFQVASGTSRHGLAINVSNDLSLFESIRVCGQSGVRLTSLEHQIGLTDMELVAATWAREWEKALPNL
jgi:lipoate-protein ligase B